MLSSSKQYKINHQVIFTPAKQELTDTQYHRRSQLQTPACLALEILLRNHGKLLARDDIIIYAWGHEALKYVSNNTFYQTMSHLRKSLEMVGCTGIINTIPRRGVQINADIHVDTFCDTPSEKNDAQDKPAPPSIRPPQPGIKLLLRRLDLYPVITTLLIIAIYITHLVTHKTESTYTTKNYQLMKTGMCQVRFMGTADNSVITRLLNRYNLDCHFPAEITITLNSLSDRQSIIVCGNKKAIRPACKTIIEVGTNYENKN